MNRTKITSGNRAEKELGDGACIWDIYTRICCGVNYWLTTSAITAQSACRGVPPRNMAHRHGRRHGIRMVQAVSWYQGTEVGGFFSIYVASFVCDSSLERSPSNYTSGARFSSQLTHLPSELAREKAWSRIHLIPVLQAEEDRDLVRRHLADQAREKELLGENIKVYNSDRCVQSS